jgi:class 3 adenylate cyclase/tetratricopeptide (TPR) repeat protein
VAICASCGHETAEEANFCPKCGAPYGAAAPAREVRKTVTVVFCDVTGSTALGESTDPEALRELLAGYFERMKAIVESHGGSVEKFIGDAVMAVFGVPVTHEDDALRACRAAVEMRDALPELGIAGRIGVNTGEVVTGTDERLVTGDAVNVAARLEQAAQPGEVLIGAATLALVTAAIEVAEERLLELKGKSEPVAGYPLVAVHEAGERAHVSRFVGRESELLQLADAWDRALTGQRCELLTVVGDPGVGKSRLVAEALARVDARVVRGRCLSYGEGITYWPVVEVVKQVGALPSDEAAANAIRSLLRESDTMAGTDEIAWAFRKLLEEQAPLVVCFDDIHWGEETFLDLVESTALLSTGAPLLFLCMARPELLDRRPGWPAVLRLEPLAEHEAGALVGAGVPDEVRERIVSASGGNPLFLTEMAALSAANVDDVEVPATLRALLAARLDQLDESDRYVLERGAVEGELFHLGAVQALAPEETEVTPRLAALVRRELVRPDRPSLPGEDAYRFRHLLVRDAAYDALPKATRADLHRRFAQWLEEYGQSLVELDEILGYHLEQAARYLDELGRPDPVVALVAGERLGAAGQRAYWRGDMWSAVVLLERSLTLTRPYRFSVHLELALARALEPTDLARMAAVSDAAGTHADAAGDGAGAALARTVAAHARMYTAECSAAELERLGRAALPLLEAKGDDEGLWHVWEALGGVANVRLLMEDRADAREHAGLHAGRAGHRTRGSSGASNAWMFGPTPASQVLARLEEVVRVGSHPFDTVVLGIALAMVGRLEEAWALASPAAATLRDFGTPVDEFLAEIALIAGDQEAAARYLRAAVRDFAQQGSTSHVASYEPMLSCVLSALGHVEEAEQLALKSGEFDFPEDVWMQGLQRQALGLVHSARGEHADAVRLAGEGVEWFSRSDCLLRQGDSYCDLAQVLEAAGRPDEAVAALREALDRYERKEIIPLVDRVRKRLAALQAT